MVIVARRDHGGRSLPKYRDEVDANGRPAVLKLGYPDEDQAREAWLLASRVLKPFTSCEQQTPQCCSSG